MKAESADAFLERTDYLRADPVWKCPVDDCYRTLLSEKAFILHVLSHAVSHINGRPLFKDPKPPPPPKPKPRETLKRDRKIVELARTTDLSYDVIGQRFHLTRMRVGQIARAAGVTRRGGPKVKA